MLICIIDIVRSEFKDSTSKLIWILIVLFLPMLGSLIYLLIGRNQKILSDSRK
ncbi:PLDc N-terminal domain-containing protein [Paradesertivirga mongoliensis]|uniref:PLDc N-terminal domain-containing protein n=2 Tax=Paradesertivirga mongoliensis TaxID=2100740 RepID=A0ABW4ZHP3_9SPHI